MFAFVCSVALTASLLTFFAGFGLGTLLLPAFVVFFPPDVAVALTAVVHFLNGLFKLALVGRRADLRVALIFGAPALVASFGGAAVLMLLSDLPPVASYALGGRVLHIDAVKLTLSVLMILFAAIELPSRFERAAVPKRYMPLGGLLTGFFGGLSGHQGALRSAFLVRAGLTKEAFVATGVVIATLVDVARLSVYSTDLEKLSIDNHGALLAAATGSAFVGAFLGNRLLRKVTYRGLQRAVAIALVVVAIGLGSGAL